MSFRTNHDILTALPSRGLFKHRLGLAVIQAKRKQTELAVMFIDLDRFKLVNDTGGHIAGDNLLREIAALLKQRVRDSDTVARVGGDEFAILVDAEDHPGHAESIAARVLESLAEPVVLDGSDVKVSASIGLAHSDHTTTAASLLRDADVAMYRAKAVGPNELAFFTSAIGKSAATRHRLEDDLRLAITSQDLELAYQPQLAVDGEGRTGDVLGVEALARWRHPDLGPIPPTTFIPLAEELGLMSQLGRWVLLEACRQAARWRDRMRVPLPVGVFGF